MKLTRAIVIGLSVLLMLVAFSLPVLADGQYGQYGAGAESPSEQPKEEVTHRTVDADLGDNLVAIGLIAGGAGLALALISRMTRRVYFLD